MRYVTTASVLACLALSAASAPTSAQQAAPQTQPAVQPAPLIETPAGPTPRLKLSTDEWDFGQKWSGELCSTEVTIENTGQATLKILRVRSSCGCTVAQPARRALEPGESDTMTIKYNTRKNKKIVSQTITIETNDPTQPRVPIRVKGEVRQLFEANPSSRLSFGRLERDAAVSKTIELSNNMEEPIPLKIKSISNSTPFDIELEEVTPGKQYKLVATTRPPLKIGANVADIVLETGLKTFPAISYSISAYVAPRVAITPKRLYVSPRVNKEFKRVIRVSYRPEKPIKITEIKSSHPDLIQAELIEQQSPALKSAITGYHMIRVTLPAGKDMPEGGASLEITTDDSSPEYQKFVVDIMLRKAPTRVLKPIKRGGDAPAIVDRPKPKAEPTATPAEKPAESKPDGEESPD